MAWIKLKDRKPIEQIDGEKVLIHRILNAGQASQNPTVMPINKVHLCDVDETWWMAIPELAMTGIELIAQERKEQLTKHGRTSTHDDSHENEDLLKAAKYAIEPCEQHFKEMELGWSHFATKIDAKTPIDRLKVAGALIAAEIDRLQRADV